MFLRSGWPAFGSSWVYSSLVQQTNVNDDGDECERRIPIMHSIVRQCCVDQKLVQVSDLWALREVHSQNCSRLKR